MKKIKMCQTAKIRDVYKDFLTSRKVRGVSEKTLETYPTCTPCQSTWTLNRILQT